MRLLPTFAALSAACLPALAQDSVSLQNNPPGDALGAYDTAVQATDYVVELTPFQSSWGNGYGVAPLIKASQDLDVNALFFTNLMSGTAMSRDLLTAVPYLRSSYDSWSAAGFGVNPDAGKNLPGTPVDTTGLIGNQFAVGFGEFGGSGQNNIIGGIVNFEDNVSSRLFVSRINAASNSLDYNCNLSQFGFGTVEAAGNVAFRADDFGGIAGCGFAPISGNNLFRVDMAARSNVVNVLHLLTPGDAAATTKIVNNSSDVHITPNIIPVSVAGAAKILGNTFGSQFVFESSPGTATYTSTHLPAGTPDSRGSVAYTNDNFPSLFGAGNANGIAGSLGYEDDGSGANNLALSLSVWGLSSTGSVSGNMRLPLPTVITDNDDGFATDDLGPGLPSFIHYWSQTAFRGGNSQVALGRDQAGRLIAAGTISHPATMGNPGADASNAIAVARVGTTGAIEWTIAAHNDMSMGAGGTGKAIEDGAGNVVGRMTSILNVTGGGLQGPSIAVPMIDSVGNIYFTAAIEMFGPAGSDLDIAILRAVYDPASFSYKLEKILAVGEVFVGESSNTPYQVRFLTVADSNSVGSAAPFSNSISGAAQNGMSTAGMEASDPRTLGGLIASATIVYDVDGDGLFDIQTGVGGNPSSVDQDYDVLLFIGAAGDCNDNDKADDLDIADGTSLDLNFDGIPDDCQVAVGTSFCLAGVNSTGTGANISATGSDSVSANTLTLLSAPVGVNVPGIFYYGATQIITPFGDGFRCVGGATVRLPFTSGGPNGVLTWDLDIQNPNPNSPAVIVAGDTWNFQGWYRDPAAMNTGFNLSNGLSITFTP